MNRLRLKTIETFFLMIAAVFASVSVVALADDVSAAGNIEIRIWPEVTVDTGRVVLGQIATISGLGDEVGALKSLPISIPVAGSRELVIRAWQVAEQISQAGFDPVDIRITGAARCKVHIVKRTERTASIEDVGSGNSSLSAVTSRGSLENKIKQLIYNHLKRYVLHGEYKLSVKFNPVIRDLLALSEPAYQFEIEPQKRRAKWVGLVALKVRVFQRGELIQTVPILVRVDLSVKVLVARRKINSKAIVSKRDVEWSWRSIKELRGKEPVKMSDLSSMRSKHLIPSGCILTKDLFEPIPLVKRGQLVTVIYHNGGLEIKTVGKAMRTGCKGEIIPVRNERSKNIFQAKVLSSGKVLVDTYSGSMRNSGYGISAGRSR